MTARGHDAERLPAGVCAAVALAGSVAAILCAFLSAAAYFAGAGKLEGAVQLGQFAAQSIAALPVVQSAFDDPDPAAAIQPIAEVIREAYPDPTANPGEPWVWVDFAAVKPLPRPISLKEIKATPALAKMALVTCMRLSVQPVLDEEWALISRMSGL